MELKTNTDIDLLALTISEGSGDTQKTIDVKEINEPLFIIQISASYQNLDNLLKSFYQLMKIIKYKNVLIFHENENHLIEVITAKLKTKFCDKIFLFAKKRVQSLNSDYKINFTSLSGVTLHYEIDVVIGEMWTYLYCTVTTSNQQPISNQSK